MVRGLLVRQVLTGINLLLALVIAYIIYLVGVQQFGNPAAARSIDELLGGKQDTAVKIASVGPRSDYDAVVNGKLFGSAGATAAPPSETPTISEQIVQTTENLRLLATVASYPDDPLATAIIENPAATTPIKITTYYLGQQIKDNLKLLEVHRRRVILLNTAKNQKEELLMEPLGSTPTLAGKTGPGATLAGGRMGGGMGAASPNQVTLERKAVVEELNNYDYADLMAQLNPQFVEDEKGNVTGVTSASLSSLPIAKQAGLQDNDVIQAVNGITIDSEQKIGEIAQKVGNANTIRLSVMRGGKPQMITVRLQ